MKTNTTCDLKNAKAKRIRFLRIKAKMKQCQLAGLCFVSPSTMCKYENASRKVPDEVLKYIFNIFQISCTNFYRTRAFARIMG